MANNKGNNFNNEIGLNELNRIYRPILVGLFGILKRLILILYNWTRFIKLSSQLKNTHYYTDWLLL